MSNTNKKIKQVFKKKENEGRASFPDFFTSVICSSGLRELKGKTELREGTGCFGSRCLRLLFVDMLPRSTARRTARVSK